MPAKRPPRIAGLVDSHCHLDYPPMADDVAGTLARAQAAGVQQIVHIGCTVGTHDDAVALAAGHPEVFAVVGVHPHEAVTVDDAVLARVAELAAHPKVVAIGETGLDYYYDHSPRDRQRDAFARHVALARSLDMPLVLHIRDAHPEALDVLAGEPPRQNPGIVHCFTGGPDDARRWLDEGWHLSFSGIVTFPKAEPVRAAARLCPDDRLLLETDAPYLAPVPNRGRKNEPANVAFTCAQLAGLRGQAPEAFAATTSRNVRALLGLPEPGA